MGNRLATVDIGRKLGGAVPLLGVGELGPHLAQCGLGPGLSPYQLTKWHLNPSSRLATIDMGRKLGGCAPF